MPAWSVRIKNENVDEAVEVWDFDEASAKDQACNWLLGMYTLADIDDTTAVPVEPFFGMHDAWRVGDWIINPWAIIHADYARIASDYEHTVPNTDRIIPFVESVQAAPAEPVAIRVDTSGRYSVVMRGGADFAERELAVMFWLPAWEMGLDWGALPNDLPDIADLPRNTHLLLDGDRVVGLAMGLRSQYIWTELWRAP